MNTRNSRKPKPPHITQPISVVRVFPIASFAGESDMGSYYIHRFDSPCHSWSKVKAIIVDMLKAHKQSHRTNVNVELIANEYYEDVTGQTVCKVHLLHTFTCYNHRSEIHLGLADPNNK